VHGIWSIEGVVCEAATKINMWEVVKNRQTKILFSCIFISTQRGKFRPRLSGLVRQNKAEEVEQVSREAIALLPNLEAAVKHLCQLKAVGPATASGKLWPIEITTYYALKKNAVPRKPKQQKVT